MGKILEIIDLKKYFKTNQGTVLAVDGVSFHLEEGETLGLVGESGSGKSTVAYMIAGIYSPTSGKILFFGRDISMVANKRSLTTKGEIQIVFQDPGTSLNPRRTIGQILLLPLSVHKIGKANERRELAEELLQMVQLPKDYFEKVPSMLGGGEKQMVAIARALATRPKLVILDEPTSALDVIIQAKIIKMLMNFQRELGLSYLFITHDLSLMRNVATRVAIMYLGKICELAPTKEFFEKPLHPYTRMLLSSIPVVSEEEEALKPKKIESRGEIPSPVNVPPGCSFHLRCPEVMEICKKVDPQILKFSGKHFVRCHLFSKNSGHNNTSGNEE
ncbi:MAG: ABC transporter ATP-binding protein [Caldiserica bacterium]|jgi:peptide/nickel transport system ATP-binding protein|nr:ABC transporter ATP-binding protein [Caldisericota bacterium]MDH7562256.1 ABC transporter ATP-binding protein [Caldisericota bacterium]